MVVVVVVVVVVVRTKLHTQHSRELIRARTTSHKQHQQRPEWTTVTLTCWHESKHKVSYVNSTGGMTHTSSSCIASILSYQMHRFHSSHRSLLLVNDFAIHILHHHLSELNYYKELSSIASICEPVWPSGKVIGWKTEGPRFQSASALISLISLHKLWSVDTVLRVCPSQL